MTWFYNDQGVAQGPLDELGMRSLINAGRIDEHTLIWHQGMEFWIEAGTLNSAWWHPVMDKPLKSAETISSGTEASHRSPIPLAPTETLQKPKSESLFQRLFGGRKKS